MWNQAWCRRVRVHLYCCEAQTLDSVHWICQDLWVHKQVLEYFEFWAREIWNLVLGSPGRDNRTSRQVCKSSDHLSRPPWSERPWADEMDGKVTFGAVGFLRWEMKQFQNFKPQTEKHLAYFCSSLRSRILPPFHLRESESTLDQVPLGFPQGESKNLCQVSPIICSTKRAKPVLWIEPCPAIIQYGHITTKSRKHAKASSKEKLIRARPDHPMSTIRAPIWFSTRQNLGYRDRSYTTQKLDVDVNKEAEPTSHRARKMSHLEIV